MCTKMVPCIMTLDKTLTSNIQYFFFKFSVQNFQFNIFVFSYFAQNKDCGYTIEPPRCSNEYSQYVFSDAWATEVDLVVK